MKPFYRLIWTLARLIGTLIFRMKVVLKGRLPESGGFIIAANHISLADPPLVAISLKRPVHFMAKKELFRNWLFGGFIRRLNAHPLKRTGIDRTALDTACRILASGEPLIVFPEGTRARDGHFLAARPGVGMIARKSKVPVIPVFITGSDRLSSCFMGKEKLLIIYGEKLEKDYIAGYEDNKEGYRKLADDILNRIKELKTVYFGRTNQTTA
jgi:1-acyl-sn-glycerol-3-phosphate acyltransferase